MKVKDLTELGYESLNLGDIERDIDGIYCGDLLSWVMGRASYNDVWVTVMGNINSAAVAVLADVSCIVLAEGSVADEQLLNKAKNENITIFQSSSSAASIVCKINSVLKKY